MTFVTKYKGSGPTASTSGELFIMVFTLDKGKCNSFSGLGVAITISIQDKIKLAIYKPNEIKTMIRMNEVKKQRPNEPNVCCIIF